MKNNAHLGEQGKSPWVEAARLRTLPLSATAIILTGGLAHSEFLVANVKKYIEHLAPVILMPGELENEALALGGLRILKGEEAAHELS